MTKLDDRIIDLIAIGASVATNCPSCLEYTIARAAENGADNQQIAQAIEIGKLVRQGAATKMDQLALALNHAPPYSANETNKGCGCRS